MVAQALRDSKTRTILVYMTLNGKEGLTACGLVYIGSHVLAPLNRSICYSCAFFNETFLLVLQVLLLFVLLLLYLIVEQWRRK